MRLKSSLKKIFTLPLWLFIAIIAVLFVSFAGPQPPPDRSAGRIIPVNPTKSITSVLGPGDAHAGGCGYCGWYSLCDNNTRWCCTQWIWAGCGGNTTNPPTISGTVTCAQTGQNGWCVNNDQLALSASDPQGYTVTITGTLNSTPFSCGSSCTLNLPKGTGTANYTATSSTSGMTASGSSTWAYDPDPPSLSSSVTAGTAGSNGWYILPVTITASASDAISGLASVQYSVDGGTWQSGSSATVSSDGTHSVAFRASDNAGNTSSVSNTIKIDQTKPALALTVSGTNGLNGWYVSPVTVTASTSDAASGIASTQYNVDGSAWQSGNSVTVSTDGSHTVEFLATDNAGNTTTDSRSFQIDQTQPSISVTPNGTMGSNNWYVSGVQVSAGASDAVSGVASLDVSVDGTWQAYSAPVSLTDGVHTVQFRATDKAGNAATTASQTIQVDTTPPLTTITSPSLGAVLNGSENITGHAVDATSGAAGVQISFDGVHWLSLQQPFANWSYLWNTTPLPNGMAIIHARSTDQAGNTSIAAQVVVTLDNHPPYLTVPSSWTLPQSGALSVAPNIIPLGEVKITVQDPSLNYPDNVLFDSLPAPQQITWNGILGRYGVAAPGSYPVIVEACDIYKLCAQSAGTISVPYPTPAPATSPIPTLPPAPAPTRVIVPTRPMPKPVDPPVLPVVIVGSAQAVPKTPIWPVVVPAGLLLMFAFLLLLDPRPAALRRLAKTIKSGVDHHDH